MHGGTLSGVPHVTLLTCSSQGSELQTYFLWRTTLQAGLSLAEVYAVPTHTILYKAMQKHVMRLTLMFKLSRALWVVLRMYRSRARAAEAGGPTMMLPVGFEQPGLDLGNYSTGTLHICTAALTQVLHLEMSQFALASKNGEACVWVDC